MQLQKRPGKIGLYDPSFEKENCGVGFVAHMKGEASRSIIEKADTILKNMTHRGAVGSEKNTGDGAGILTTLPHNFLRRAAKEAFDRELPEDGKYSAGNVFLPTDKKEREFCKKRFEEITAELGQDFIGWRKLDIDNSMIGPTALASEPVIEQAFIASRDGLSQEDFERKLFIIKKYATHQLRGKENDKNEYFYVCSLSTKIIVYKGMLMPEQIMPYYSDLKAADFVSHLAMVHSRFSTNTFPSWDRAQPLRFMSHNGEINTLRGNKNKMFAREGTLESTVFGDDISKLFPIVEPDLSDSGSFDNVLELLYMAGRSMPEAIMMMIPEAWENRKVMDQAKRDFYEYQSCIMEPWDGPASIAFTDGSYIGAVLDRNGLRPSRYYITKDDMVVMASEAGVLEIDPANVAVKGRLTPGKMFLVDFEEGRIIDDTTLKKRIATQKPYGRWLLDQRISLSEIQSADDEHGFQPQTLSERLKMFGYTTEHLNLILAPMAENHKEPLGSMGNDSPLACLSQRPKLIYDYFKQLFAQVTNPPIDSIREKCIMSLGSYIGPEGNLLEPGEKHCHRLFVPMPILDNEEVSALKKLDYRGWKSFVIDMTYDYKAMSMLDRLDQMCNEAETAIDEGYSIIVLSDRNADRNRVPISALLSTASVHHHLIRKVKRTQIGIVLESGEPKEIHHFCMLTGYGADAINPYLAFEAMWQLRNEKYISPDMDDRDIVQAYKEAAAKGMRKVFGKMGISTLNSYKGAQIFEAIGLNSEVINRSFTNTVSRIEGVGYNVLEKEAFERHKIAYPQRKLNRELETVGGGDYQYRASGDKHMWDPEAIAYMQIAARQNDYGFYKRFSEIQNRRSKDQATLRGMLRFKKKNPVPIEEVEPVSEIVKRFVTGAMSFGSISKEAHETLAIALNRLGGKSNTGEGGEDPARFKPLPNGDSKRSAIKQVASGRFGVTIEYLTNADELQIKIVQGAKPGEGGELPGHKVFEVIARTRHTTPGVGLISPPPHHDIYSIEDLSQLIFDLKNSNPGARISVKLVSEAGVGTVAAGVSKGHADHILISGHDGGTGASPLTGIKNAGLPWELGVAETHQTLVMNNLRSRVVLQTDGQIKTGRGVVIAALLGAEEYGFATSALISMGCVMMRKCQKNTCPVGIATQDPELRKRFTGKPEHVENYLRMIARETREIMAELGFRTINEMIGKVDILEPDPDVLNWKSAGLDLSPLLIDASSIRPEADVYCTTKQEHGIEAVLDRKLIELSKDAIEKGRPVSLEMPISNTDRATGTMLSHEISKRYGMQGLGEKTITAKFNGSAGQSFGGWLAKGVTFELEGDANDYVGKGLSGGELIIYPPGVSSFRPEKNILIGNVALYGAIQGKAFLRGMAAERFCVRNSGAQVVVEGVGDHGCEYMTGGRAIIIGPVGINFAAGMSGGIAYIWDPQKEFVEKCNRELVLIEGLTQDDQRYVVDMLEEHYMYTKSVLAEHLLSNWKDKSDEFLRVIPKEYKRITESETDMKEAAYG
ncbi:MAG: glutamate synthase large subunit [Spirochaetia bacterium]